MTGALWENYCSEHSSVSVPGYSRTAVGPLALLLELVIGIQPDALHQRIRWNLPEGNGWGIERIPLGAATVDLQIRWDGRLRVATDRRFTLEVVRDGRSQFFEIAAGDHDLQLAAE